MATLRFSTLDDQLTLRASYAEAFLAPYLETATYDYSYSYSDVLMDPATGDPIEALIYGSGTPNIKPETSETVNYRRGPHAERRARPDGFAGLLPDSAEPTSCQVPRARKECSMVWRSAPSSYGTNIGPSGEDVIVETYFYNAGQRRSSGVRAQRELCAAGILHRHVQGRCRAWRAWRRSKSRTAMVDWSISPVATIRRAAPSSPPVALPKTRGLVGLSWEQGAVVGGFSVQLHDQLPRPVA